MKSSSSEEPEREAPATVWGDTPAATAERVWMRRRGEGHRTSVRLAIDIAPGPNLAGGR